MGAYLDSPIKDKNPEDDSSDQCSWGICSMQGWRTGMEDSHLAVQVDLGNGSKGMLFGVFDGHGGKDVAQQATEQFKDVFINLDEFSSKNYSKALEQAFLKFDDKVSTQDYAQDTGTTSCVIFFTDKEIYCANAGDSRAVLSNNGKATPLSEDHKPGNVEELNRIQKAKHSVEDDRVDGNLALSRAFGDFQYKDQKGLQQKDQAVTAFPEIQKRDRNANDQFIILACDGIWDCLSNQGCVEKLEEYMKKYGEQNLSQAVGNMFDDILAPNTDEGIGTDNMTAILIKFK